MANAKKTKKDFYAEIMTALADNKEIVDFCTHEIELLGKRKSGESKTAKENAPLAELVYNALAENKGRLTFGEIKAIVPDVANASPQKMTGIVKPLVESGRITKEVDKKITYFKAVIVEPIAE